MLTETDDLEATQAVESYVRIVYEQRTEIKRLQAELKQTRESELFRVQESNNLASDNSFLRKDNTFLANENESYRLLLADIEAMMSETFPRIVATVQHAKRRVSYSETHPQIRSVAS